MGGECLKRRKKKKKTERVIIVLVFVLMISLGSIAFLKSSIFNLGKIEIIGNKNLKENEVVDLESLMTNKNIFTYNLKGIKNEILENPYVEDAQVKIKLPNKIIIPIIIPPIIAITIIEYFVLSIENFNILGKVICQKTSFGFNALLVPKL